MKQLVLNSQAQKGNAAGQKKAQEDIKALRTKTEQDSAELKSQTEIMQKAADVRGVSTESFMKMREKLEDSNDKLAVLQEQQEKMGKAHNRAIYIFRIDWMSQIRLFIGQMFKK